ncbi:MAG: glycosyltransferase family 2 protein [Deltaproteobacteria bacterium]|nr:glycosyltransferase family 2 protein [Deltaproteobacteria bacterium]
MIDGKKIAVVVPAYNEARAIAVVLSSMPSYVDEIVVVDDGSSDDTAKRTGSVLDRRVLLVRHRINRGVGAAIVTGYTLAFANGADAVAVMAGDGQMDPDDLPALLRPVLDGEVEYAKGDRLSHPRAKQLMPLFRWLGNRLFSTLTRWITGLTVRDSQCGYTVLSRQAAHALPLDAIWRGYGYPNDILGWIACIGGRVTEVVVKPVYRDETSGLKLRHAFFVVPYVLIRVLGRRIIALQNSTRMRTRALRRIYRVGLPPWRS